MNLHVTNDDNGIFPGEIAKRIKESGWLTENRMVNLSTSAVLRHEIITYIPITGNAIKKYVKGIEHLNKIIFHPYNYNSDLFLQIILEKFPNVKVYWVCWSYELYNLQHPLYEPFSENYLNTHLAIKKRIRQEISRFISIFNKTSGLKKTSRTGVNDSFRLIHNFCSLLPSDFTFFQSVSRNTTTKYLPFAYLSLNKIMPDLDNFKSLGKKIMIGHASSPDGNHYEIIQKLSAIDRRFPVFLPLAYGDKDYGNIIKQEARKKFIHPDIQEKKLESTEYYKKLTEVGWAIFNMKVQQALGNILALIWMGAKVFLDKNTSTYKDFTTWGIVLFTVQHDLNAHELTHKLSESEVKNNKLKILERFNEEKVSGYWKAILK